LVLVRPCAELEGAERPTLEFETLTLAPIDLNLVNTSLMLPFENDWLNAYHARIRDAMQDDLSKGEKAWLETATQAI
jgi:Xaa-Pro aminopeptidase